MWLVTVSLVTRPYFRICNCCLRRIMAKALKIWTQVYSGSKLENFNHFYQLLLDSLTVVPSFWFTGVLVVYIYGCVFLLVYSIISILQNTAQLAFYPNNFFLNYGLFIDCTAFLVIFTFTACSCWKSANTGSFSGHMWLRRCVLLFAHPTSITL